MSEKKKNVHDGHRNRLRKKIVTIGAENMPSHEILEFLLFHTIPYKDTNELSHKLINTFGSLSAVLNADFSDLCQVDGIGEVTAAFIASLPNIFKAYSIDLNKKKSINSVYDVAAYLMPKFTATEKELVYIVCLDSGNKIINCCLVSKGSSNKALLENRSIIEAVIRNNCNTVILAHNHPHTSPKPSNEDKESTYQIMKLLDNIGVTLIDHLIFSNDDFFSMASVNEYSYMFN